MNAIEYEGEGEVPTVISSGDPDKILGIIDGQLAVLKTLAEQFVTHQRGSRIRVTNLTPRPEEKRTMVSAVTRERLEKALRAVPVNIREMDGTYKEISLYDFWLPTITYVEPSDHPFERLCKELGIK